MLAKGASLPTGIAFLLAAPVVNPIVIASTWVAFSGRPLFVVGRIGLTIIIAMGVSLVLGMRTRPGDLLVPSQLSPAEDAVCRVHDHHHTDQHDPPPPGKLALLAQHISSELFEMGRFLVIGAAIAAALQTFVPRSVLLAFGQGPVVSVLVLILLAMVLSVCSTVDAFVALAFVNIFLPGAVLAFLVFGPMVDIKSVLLFSSTFRRRIVAVMVLLIFQMVVLAGVVMNLYFL